MHHPRRWMSSLLLVCVACGPKDGEPAETDPATTTDDGTTGDTTPPPPETTSGPAPDPSSTGTDPSTGPGPDPDSSSGSDDGETEGDDPGPMVDVSDPQLYEFEFDPDDADPEASLHLDTQLAFVDTQVTIRGRLVVFLHGAGSPTTCSAGNHGRMLAGLGFHYFSPCYVSNYGVGNCDDDIGGCRLEAFEGVDHTDVIDIPPPDSIERRVVRGLEHLQMLHPGGDWQYYLDGDQPRWDRIIISGSSHGASSSGVVGMNRMVDRVVMLSGPLDSGQAWLQGDPITPIERFWAFTHTDDGQHDGHLESFEDLGLLGDPAVVDGAEPPYGDSHRLVSSAPTANGHGSTTAGGSSPMDGEDWVFQPVWNTMYLEE